MSEVKEKTFLVSILGENFEYRNLIGQALGAPEDKSDLAFYNRLDASLGQVFTAITPIDYPEKLKPFLQSLIISNIHILVIDLDVGLNAAMGEILVGLDLFHQLFKTVDLVVIANITSKTEWKLEDLKKKLDAILKTTSLKGTEVFEIKQKDDYDKLKRKVVELGLTLPESEVEKAHYAKVLIDHSFPVKGIGTVILGVVKKGIVTAGQMMELIGYSGPSKKLIIKSIQKFDRDFKTASEGDRIGFALKGNIAPEEISRDNIFVSQGIFKHEKEIKATVYVNQFYKPKTGTIKPGDDTQYAALVELKTTPLKFLSGEELAPGKSGVATLSFEKPLVHDGTGLKGIIVDLNRFENKLRIVGHFIQSS